MPRLDVRRFVVAGLLAATTLANSACFASFPLTRKVYAFNKNVSSEKWVQELVFLGIGVLVPVYGVAGLIDMVILNSMEFWTGKPALTSSAPQTKVRHVAGGDIKIVQTMSVAAGTRTMVLEEYVKGALHSRTTLTQAAGAPTVTANIVHADGRQERRALTVDEAGRFTVTGSRQMPRTLAPAEIDALTAQLSQLSQRAN